MRLLLAEDEKEMIRYSMRYAMLSLCLSWQTLLLQSFL